MDYFHVFEIRSSLQKSYETFQEAETLNSYLSHVLNSGYIFKLMYIYIYIHIFIHTHIYVYTHIRMHAHIYTRAHICICTVTKSSTEGASPVNTAFSVCSPIPQT